MDSKFDVNRYICPFCGHRWGLSSDRLLSGDEIENWFKEIMYQHYEVCKIYRQKKENVQ